MRALPRRFSTFLYRRALTEAYFRHAVLITRPRRLAHHRQSRSSRQLPVEAGLQTQRHPRPLLLRMETAHQTAVEDHVYRHVEMGDGF